MAGAVSRECRLLFASIWSCTFASNHDVRSPVQDRRKKLMFEILKGMITGKNEFASGGLLLMIAGGITVWLRAVPEALWCWIVRQTTMIVTVTDDDAAFV